MDNNHLKLDECFPYFVILIYSCKGIENKETKGWSWVEGVHVLKLKDA